MARLEPEFRALTEDDIQALIRIGKQQAALVNELGDALQAGDTLRVVDLARRIVGLEKEVVKQ